MTPKYVPVNPKPCAHFMGYTGTILLCFVLLTERNFDLGMDK